MVTGDIPKINIANVDGYFVELSHRNYAESGKVDDPLCKALLLNSLIVDA